MSLEYLFSKFPGNGENIAFELKLKLNKELPHYKDLINLFNKDKLQNFLIYQQARMCEDYYFTEKDDLLHDRVLEWSSTHEYIPFSALKTWVLHCRMYLSQCNQRYDNNCMKMMYINSNSDAELMNVPYSNFCGLLIYINKDFEIAYNSPGFSGNGRVCDIPRYINNTTNHNQFEIDIGKTIFVPHIVAKDHLRYLFDNIGNRELSVYRKGKKKNDITQEIGYDFIPIGIQSVVLPRSKLILSIGKEAYRGYDVNMFL